MEDLVGNRDSQRKKVYDAEFEIRDLLEKASQGYRRFEMYGSVFTVETDLKFGRLAHVQTYVNAVLAQPWVQERWPKMSSFPITVRHRKGDAAARYESGTIALHEAKTGQSWSLRQIVVLHEIAHHLEFGERHGPAFVAAFCELVTQEISHEVGYLLRVSMLENGAKINI
jgi:putative metallohydrolase (TIGR04338 family)